MPQRIRKSTTYPNRSEHLFIELGKLTKNKPHTHIVDVGPGLAWKKVAHLLPPHGRPRKERILRDHLVKYADRIARIFIKNGKHLVSFEPFELVKTLKDSSPNGSFTLTVVDRIEQTRYALKNNSTKLNPGDKILFLRGDIETVDLPKADILVAQQVLYTTNRNLALKNITNCLSSGGLLVCHGLTPIELSTYGYTAIKHTAEGTIYRKK